MATDGVGQRFQQGRGFANPVSQGGAVQLETFTVEDLALAVKRQMIGILADQNVGQQTRAGAAAFDGARGQLGLNEAFAAGAGQPGADDAIHDEAPGDVFQFFGHIFADPAQAPAAVSAGISARGQFDLHPGDMVGDRTTLRFVLLLDVRKTHPRGHRGGGDLAGLKRQLQLFCRLRRRAKPMRGVPGQLVPQLLDQDCLRLHFRQKPRGESAQFLGVVGQSQGLIEHVISLSHCIRCGNPLDPGSANYPATKGRHVRCSTRQSIPSSSIDNWPGDSATFPSFAEGQTNRPFSSRFMNMQAPWPSHQITPTATEDEQMPAKRVLLQHGLSLRGQRRKALAHVGDARRQPDPRVGRDRDQTDSPRISRASASGS
jgi:hypothetical protein